MNFLSYLPSPLPKNSKKTIALYIKVKYANTLPLLKKGIFRHYMIDTLGKQKILKFSLKNEFVSDCESFMYQKPALYSIQAIEDAKIILFKNSQLKKLSEQYPVLARINNQIVQQILSSYKEHLMIIMNLSPNERYQYVLQNQPELILRISVKYLSQFLGLSRETVSRLRSKAM